MLTPRLPDVLPNLWIFVRHVSPNSLTQRACCLEQYVAQDKSDTAAVLHILPKSSIANKPWLILQISHVNLNSGILNNSYLILQQAAACTMVRGLAETSHFTCNLRFIKHKALQDLASLFLISHSTASIPFHLNWLAITPHCFGIILHLH